MNATLPLWAEYGSDEDAALAAALAEDAVLIAAGEELLARLESEKLRGVVQRRPKWEPVLPDFAI